MTPEQKAIVAVRTLDGLPTRAIAQEIGMSHTAVENARKRPEIKSYLENEYAELMHRGLKPSRRTMCRLAAMGTAKKYANDKDMLGLAYKAASTILSHANGAPGTVIYNLTQVHDNSFSDLSGITGFLQSQWAQATNGHTLDHSTTGINQAHTPPQCSTVCNDVIEAEAVQDAPDRATNAPKADISRPKVMD